MNDVHKIFLYIELVGVCYFCTTRWSYTRSCFKTLIETMLVHLNVSDNFESSYKWNFQQNVKNSFEQHLKSF